MIRVLRHRKTSQRYIARVWLDDTKTDAEGNPDPRWVKQYTWELFPTHNEMPEEQATQLVREYEEMQVRWLRRQARRDLEEMTEGAGAPMVSEGEDL